MLTTDFDVLGNAMMAFWKRQDDTPFRILINGFEEPAMHPSAFFRKFSQMREYEKKALKLVKGKVLDLGCGAGCHSVYLKKKGFEVEGIEISQLSAQVAAEQGVTVHLADWRTFSGKGFDTILVLMNGMGMINEINELDAFFKKLRGLLSEDGQIIIDSTNIQYARSMWEYENPEYYGHVQFELFYKRKSQSFFWVFVDQEKALKAAKKARLNAEILLEEEGGHYLLRLTKVRK